jgi:hypothetical protein
MRIADSKFRKSRLVPLHGSTVEILRNMTPSGIACLYGGRALTSFARNATVVSTQGKSVVFSTPFPER